MTDHIILRLRRVTDLLVILRDHCYEGINDLLSRLPIAKKGILKKQL